MTDRFELSNRRMLLAYLAEQKRLFVLGIVALVFTNICTAGIPYLTKLVFDTLEGASGEALQQVPAAQQPAVAEAAQQHVIFLVLGIIGLAIGLMVFRTASRVLIFDGGRRVEFRLRNDLYDHMQRLGPSFFGRMAVGDLVSRTTNDITAVRLLGGPGVLQLANTLIVYVVVLIPMMTISPRLTAYALTPLLMLYVAGRTVGPQIYKRSFAAQTELSRLTALANESIVGIQVVQAYRREAVQDASFEQASDLYRKSYLAFILYRSVLLPMLVGMGGIGTLIILYFGGRSVIAGSLSLGDFVALLGYLAMMMWPTVALGWMISLWQRGRAAMDRLAEIFRTEPDVSPPIAAEGESLESAELEGRLRFEGLSFAHPSASGPGREVLRDISLEVEAGEQVLVVGPSGSGKTTLVSLIPHLSSVPRGSVFLGGRDLNDIPLKTLRSQVAFVPQDAFLFSMTVAENIGFGLDEPDNDAILAAARLAALERDMERFPQGLQTLVGERGVTLSGGQRQRMTIARAAILKPRVWVFDDCLSSVDAGTEQRIIRNLRTMTAEATAIFVTHRLLGFEGVDRVVVLQDGCITETGTHEELLALGGWYSRLYRRQKLDQDLSHGPSEPEPVEDRSW